MEQETYKIFQNDQVREYYKGLVSGLPSWDAKEPVTDRLAQFYERIALLHVNPLYFYPMSENMRAELMPVWEVV